MALIGQRLAGAWVGVGGGSVCGMLPAVQFHLQEGRPYALVAAGAGITTLLLVTAPEKVLGGIQLRYHSVSRARSAARPRNSITHSPFTE